MFGQLFEHCVRGGKQLRGLLFLNSWHALTASGECHSREPRPSTDDMSSLAWGLEMVRHSHLIE